MGQSFSKDEFFDKDKISNFKVAIIGEPEVGKSAILQRYAKNRFTQVYSVTKRAVVENVVKKINVPSQSLHSVTLWDLPGREDIDLRESYYRNVDAAIVVVDMNDPDSIDLAPAWKQDFVNKVSKTRTVKESMKNGVDVSRTEYLPCDPSSIPVLLLGNKYDIIENKLQEEKMQLDLEMSEKRRAQQQKDAESSSVDLRTDDEDDDDENDDKEVDAPKLDENLKKQIDGPVEKSEDDEKEEETEKTFALQRGPKKNEKRPECVKHLEEIEEKHGFVGSIMVSAKEPDGSVHAAIESFIRFLLEPKLPLKQKKMILKKKKKAKVVVEEEKIFTATGVDEIDKIFERCESPMKCARDYTDYYEIVLQKFKQKCADHGYLAETKASLEDCIIGIRDSLKHDTGVALLVRDKDGSDFVVLDHELDARVKIPKEIPITLDQFNNEFVPLCEAVLRDCPSMEVVFGKLEKKATNAWEKFDKKLLPEHRPWRDEIEQICDKNRARIVFARSLNKEVLTNVRNAKEKVKTALIW